ncbi:glycosyltransferase [Roseateles sp. GG27B]
MKILILLRDLSLNGISTYNRNLANELSLQGHEVHAGRPTRPSSRRACATHPPPLGRAAGAPLVQWINPDVILVSHFTQARLAHKLKQSTGIPWVACMHNGHSPQRMAEWAQLFSNAAGVVTLCDHAGANSKLLASSVQAGKPLAPVLLSRLPIAIPEPRQRRSDAPLKLAYCSRLSGGKGPLCEAWLQAVAALPGHERYKLLVMGGGNYCAPCAKRRLSWA